MWTNPIPWLPEWPFEYRVGVYVLATALLAVIVIAAILYGGN